MFNGSQLPLLPGLFILFLSSSFWVVNAFETICSKKQIEEQHLSPETPTGNECGHLEETGNDNDNDAAQVAGLAERGWHCGTVS